MTEQELKLENEKLNARLQKAVTVFNDQKAQIKRLTEERDAAIAKTSEANKQDELFFEQQNEIEELKKNLANTIKENKEMVEQSNLTITALKGDLENANKSNEELQSRLTKAQEVFKAKEAELTSTKANLDTLLKRNNSLVSTITKMQDLCKETIEQM